MCRIIINADDFGLSPVVNQEIEMSLKNDWISSTSIMANSNYMDYVQRVVESYPDKSFGVHLNITEGLSLTKNPVMRKSGMIDDNGCFIKKNNFNSRLYDEELQKAIQDEWDAQVYEVLSRGVKVSHVDGHHHCHTWYGYADPLIAVLNRYNIQKVRNTFNTPFVTPKVKFVEGLSNVLFTCHLIDMSNEEKISNLSPAIRSCIDKNVFLKKTKSFIKTMYFDAYKTINAHVQGQLLSSFFSNNIVIELMCHPGHPTYQKEYELVKNDTIRIGADHECKMISYNEL